MVDTATLCSLYKAVDHIKNYLDIDYQTKLETTISIFLGPNLLGHRKLKTLLKKN